MYFWRGKYQETLNDVLKMVAIQEPSTFQLNKSFSRNGFLQADIQASLIGAKVNLVIGQGVKALTYELYEAKLAQKKSDLNSILFRLAERSLELESRLEKADMEIAGLRQQQKTSAVGDSSGLILDLDAKRNKQPKIQPKKPGMSAVNPASRKRRAAHGVQFD